jgi:hypothetical protein
LVDVFLRVSSYSLKKNNRKILCICDAIQPFQFFVSRKCLTLSHGNSRYQRPLLPVPQHPHMSSRPSFPVAYAQPFLQDQVRQNRVQIQSRKDDVYLRGSCFLLYLKWTKTFRLHYGGVRKDEMLSGMTDADWAGDRSEQASISGFVWSYGGGPIGWLAKKQNCVALSSTRRKKEFGFETRFVKFKYLARRLSSFQPLIFLWPRTILLMDVQRIDSFHPFSYRKRRFRHHSHLELDPLQCACTWKRRPLLSCN